MASVPWGSWVFSGRSQNERSKFRSPKGDDLLTFRALKVHQSSPKDQTARPLQRAGLGGPAPLLQRVFACSRPLILNAKGHRKVIERSQTPLDLSLNFGRGTNGRAFVQVGA